MFLMSKSIFFFFFLYSEVKMAYRFHNKIDFFRAVFGCISKNFLEKIFWCLEKKKENTNSEKHKPQPRPRRRSRSREGEIAIFARSRRQQSRSGAIAISIRSRDPVRSQSRSDREIRCDRDPVR